MPSDRRGDGARTDRANRPWRLRESRGDAIGCPPDAGGYWARTASLKLNPYPSPQAIVVQDNAAADIAGAINATTVAFDFDYDNNVQGGRAAGTDAAVVLVAAGLEAAQVAVASGLTISRATGLSFTVPAAAAAIPIQQRIDRNYENPA